MQKLKDNLHIIIIALLIVNIILTIIPLFNTAPSSKTASTQIRSVEDIMAENKAINAYYKELGKNNFKITNESVYTSSYGSKSIKGIIKNIGTKEFDSVSIRFKLYKDGMCIGSANDYVSYFEPGEEYQFDAYVSSEDDFDEFKLAEISAIEE